MRGLFLAVALLCSAVVQAASLPTGTTYVVNLSWTAPSSSPDPVAGYFIHRALINGPFAQLNQTPIVGIAYVDSGLQYGVTYEYYATSVDAGGNQSVPSNTVTLPIPFVPNPPVMGTIQGL
jgi:hypothetical protein